MLVAQSCPTLCNPENCSPPGSSVHEISQARISKWVVIPFSRRSLQPRDGSQVFCIAGRFLNGLSHQESLCFMGMRRQFFSLSTAVMSLISAFERGVCAAAPSTLSASLIWYRVLNLNHLQELAGAQSEELSTTQARNFCMQPLSGNYYSQLGCSQVFLPPFQKGHKSLIWKMMSNPQVPFFYLIYPARPRVFCFNVW